MLGFLLGALSWATPRLPPMERVEVSFKYTDDLNLEYMLQAIERQENHFLSLDLNQPIQIGKRHLNRQHLYRSLLAFQAIVMETRSCFEALPRLICDYVFDKKIQGRFEAYRPIPLEWERGAHNGQTFFTAYFTPDFRGSLIQTEQFKNPIYAMPRSRHLRSKTSDQINFEGALKGHNLELFYVDASLYDIWLLHVQGGGRIRVKQPDQKERFYYLSYAGTNKKTFKMLYRYMIDQGMIDSAHPTVPVQRAYLESHPEKMREVLAVCPSYVYFRISEDEPAGVHVPLTVGRSLATDYRRFLEYGLIQYIRLDRPDPENQGNHHSMHRFFISQDTGGAIKGNARADLYLGYGEKAAKDAYNTHHLGEQYILILK